MKLLSNNPPSSTGLTKSSKRVFWTLIIFYFLFISFATAISSHSKPSLSHQDYYSPPFFLNYPQPSHSHIQSRPHSTQNPDQQNIQNPIPSSLFQFRTLPITPMPSSPPPVQFRSTCSDSTLICLQWEPPVHVPDFKIRSYTIQFRKNFGPWLNNTESLLLKAVAKNLSARTTYDFRVVAVSSKGVESTPSKILSVTTKPGPPCPLKKLFCELDSQVIECSWVNGCSGGSKILTLRVDINCTFHTRVAHVAYNLPHRNRKAQFLNPLPGGWCRISIIPISAYGEGPSQSIAVFPILGKIVSPQRKRLSFGR
eukprot:TRINITY_DN15347_c0_g1_i1.p1 TRINITY_DN15347_c0_g1~~TRINITY_DN15347_c0_g1_i1.p1  ORF type:complete len:311 (+),score=32.90 TRINITY_DN15347_c0_g1_i1:51-983(+)